MKSPIKVKQKHAHLKGTDPRNRRKIQTDPLLNCCFNDSGRKPLFRRKTQKKFDCCHVTRLMRQPALQRACRRAFPILQPELRRREKFKAAARAVVMLARAAKVRRRVGLVHPACLRWSGRRCRFGCGDRPTGDSRGRALLATRAI